MVVYSPQNCPFSQSGSLALIYGNGDFDSSGTPASLDLRDVGVGLSELPSATRSLVVDVAQAVSSTQWNGTAEVPASGDVNVLVWPDDSTCRLTQDVQPRTTGALGAFGAHVMIAGGSLPGRVPYTFVGDLRTGKLTQLPIGLGTRRQRASITPFPTSNDQEPMPALVAGGEDPDTQTPIATAEVYLPDPGQPGGIGDFAPDRIPLSEARTKHGAVMLATGETLLVGGIGQFGAPLATMEIVSPTDRRARTNGVALLDVARTNPTVLRLASGEILVVGGVNLRNDPISTIEWFSPDASQHSKRNAELVTGRDRAFVPLEAGGALAVIIPANDDPAFNTVWVISADGTLEAGTPVNPSTLDKVRLFPGAAGGPVLWTGLQWQRWRPWAAAFQPIANAPSVGPSTTAITNGDSGLALWLDDSSTSQLFVTGYRFDTQSRFGSPPGPFLTENMTGLAPDRIAGRADSAIRFDDEGLHLGSGASAFVTDTTFADVSASIDTTGATAIVLRQDDSTELSVGGNECPYATPPTKSLRVERTGTTVHYSIDDAPLRACTAQLKDGTRLRIGLRGADSTGTTVTRNLQITRR